MASRDERNIDVEYLYRNVMHEIDRALLDGDTNRASAMAKRAATGRPKVLPKLNVGSENEQQIFDLSQEDQSKGKEAA